MLRDSEGSRVRHSCASFATYYFFMFLLLWKKRLLHSGDHASCNNCASRAEEFPRHLLLSSELSGNEKMDICSCQQRWGQPRWWAGSNYQRSLVCYVILHYTCVLRLAGHHSWTRDTRNSWKELYFERLTYLTARHNGVAIKKHAL